MNTNKKRLSPERIARLLAVAAATNTLPDDIVPDALAVVQLVDDGATRSKVNAGVQRLIDSAWIRAGREAATASAGKATKNAVQRLKGVADLEQQLGLGPAVDSSENHTEPAPATDTATEEKVPVSESGTTHQTAASDTISSDENRAAAEPVHSGWEQ